MTMGAQKRELLEYAVHAVTAQAAKANDLVDEAIPAGLAEDLSSGSPVRSLRPSSEEIWSSRAVNPVSHAADMTEERTEYMERVHEQPKTHHRARAGVVKDESVERGVNTTDLERELDDLLDEVDSVLEENAEEFVKAYVQKGGE